MKRVRINIDTVVLKGFDPADRKAILEGLQSELARVVSDPSMQADLAGSQRTPVLRLGALRWQSGPSGSRNFGQGVARAIGKGLKA